MRQEGKKQYDEKQKKRNDKNINEDLNVQQINMKMFSLPFNIKQSKCIKYSDGSKIYECEIKDTRQIEKNLDNEKKLYNQIKKLLQYEEVKQNIQKNTLAVKENQKQAQDNKIDKQQMQKKASKQQRIIDQKVTNQRKSKKDKKIQQIYQQITVEQVNTKCSTIIENQNIFAESALKVKIFKDNDLMKQFESYFYNLKNFLYSKWHLKGSNLFLSQDMKNNCSEFKLAYFKLSYESKQKQEKKVKKQDQSQTDKKPQNPTNKAQNQNQKNNNNTDNKVGTIADKVTQYQLLFQNFSYATTLNMKTNQLMENFMNFLFDKQSQKKNQLQKLNSKQPHSTYFYSISQYHRGHTLRELILSNWKGFQDYQILIPLIRKLFFIFAQLDMYGFYYHLPSFDNIIIDDYMKNPDVNINLASIMYSRCLYKNQKENLLVKKQFYQQLMPFLFQDDFEEQQQEINKQKNFIGKKLNRKRNFLIIILFMLIRRFDAFENTDNIKEKLKQFIQVENKKQSENKQSSKEKLYKNQITNKNQQIGKPNISIKNDQKNSLQQNSKNQEVVPSKFIGSINTLIKILSQQQYKQVQKHHLLTSSKFTSKVYEKILTKPLNQVIAITNLEKIRQSHTNLARIKNFQQQYLSKQNILIDIFMNTFLQSQKSIQITWRRLYQIFFLKNIQEKICSLKDSKILNLLSKFYKFPSSQSKQLSYVPPEIYFCFKFQINIQYFNSKFNGQWYLCFDISQQEQQNKKIQYDIQIICLLKNIMKEVVSQSIKSIEQSIRLNFKYEKIKNCVLKNKQNQDQAQKLCRKWKIIRQDIQNSSILLQYLQKYRKKAYIKELKVKKCSQVNDHENKQIKTIKYFQQDFMKIDEILRFCKQIKTDIDNKLSELNKYKNIIDVKAQTNDGLETQIQLSPTDGQLNFKNEQNRQRLDNNCFKDQQIIIDVHKEMKSSRISSSTENSSQGNRGPSENIGLYEKLKQINKMDELNNFITIVQKENLENN